MNSRILAISLFIALGLMVIPIPFIAGNSIAALIVLIVGIIMLLKK